MKVGQTSPHLVLFNAAFPGAIFIDTHGWKVFDFPSDCVVRKSLKRKKKNSSLFSVSARESWAATFLLRVCSQITQEAAFFFSLQAKTTSAGQGASKCGPTLIHFDKIWKKFRVQYAHGYGENETNNLMLIQSDSENQPFTHHRRFCLNFATPLQQWRLKYKLKLRIFI